MWHGGPPRTRAACRPRVRAHRPRGPTLPRSRRTPERAAAHGTLGALRDARRAWRTEQARVHAGLPEHDPTTTLVVGRWDYLGSGYSPGATLLATHVWHRKELEQQFTAEGDC
ncbi:hypothetical protein [Streptomyces pseudogriseolus]|uniref:hypothetical protein n=1 Tax=Streptomyces pseudogriseolus TaxID=36817 RepID=UPI003FA2BAB2